MSSFTHSVKDSGDTPMISSPGEKKKSIEDMTKEELLQLFQEIRAQTCRLQMKRKKLWDHWKTVKLKEMV
jgi:hypothetical protein